MCFLTFTLSLVLMIKISEKYYISRKNKIRLRRNWVKFINSLNILENRSHNSLISAGRLKKQKNYLQLLDFLKDSSKNYYLWKWITKK